MAAPGYGHGSRGIQDAQGIGIAQPLDAQLAGLAGHQRQLPHRWPARHPRSQADSQPQLLGPLHHPVALGGPPIRSAPSLCASIWLGTGIEISTHSTPSATPARSPPMGRHQTIRVLWRTARTAAMR